MSFDSLASGLNGSNAGSYSYTLKVVGLALALIVGLFTILDATSNGVVSSFTAASCLATKTSTLFSTLFTVLFLAESTIAYLLGLRDSSALALSIFTLHTCAILALFIARAVACGRSSSTKLLENWHNALSVAGSAANLSGKSIAWSISDSTVVAFFGLTGFETNVAYAGTAKPVQFRKALRNIWLTAALLEAPVALLALA